MEPLNYFQNIRTGEITDLGPSMPTWGNLPGTPDYANPIEIVGVGKGWLLKGDPTMTVYNNQGQRIATLGNDMAASRKRETEQIGMEHGRLQNQKLLKEINATGRAADLKLVDGQWILPPSQDNPTGRALPVEGFQRRSIDKVTQEKANAELAKSRVDELLGNLQGHYQTLRERGAVVSPERSPLGNVGTRLAASGLGQLTMGAVGTKEQEIRDKIEMAKPLLINEIRAATGMSAKAMDSNAELKFYLQAATDPTKSVEANLEALRYLSSAYGLGALKQGGQVVPGMPPEAQPPMQMPTPTAPQNAVDASIRDSGAFIEAGGKRYVVIRRNPDGSAVIRDPQTGRTGTMRQ